MVKQRLHCGLQKFARQKVRQKGSSPKFLVYNTALMTAQLPQNYQEIRHDPVILGRVVESAIGAHLLNAIRGTQMELFYWREGDVEVDFVIQHGKRLIALEVKTNQESFHRSGIDSFVEKFKPTQVLLIGPKGISIETFLKTPLEKFLR